MSATRRANIVKVRDSSGHVVAGVRPDDGVLQKTISGQRHMLRSPSRAISFDVLVLDAAERAGAWRIEVTDSDTTKTYSVNLNDFRARAFRVDRGYGPQLALALEHWNKPDAQPDPRQLDLWGARG